MEFVTFLEISSVDIRLLIGDSLISLPGGVEHGVANASATKDDLNNLLQCSFTSRFRTDSSKYSSPSSSSVISSSDEF